VIIIAYDIGTTGVKTCLFDIADAIVKLDSESASYPIYVLPDGGVEQDPDDWWTAMCQTTSAIAQRCPEQIAQLAGISFCSQLQSMILVDEQLRPVHRSMSYMDQRAGRELREIAGQWPRVAGVNVATLLRSLRHTGAVAASVKDPVWKYHWLRRHEPDEFARGHKWLDVKDAIVARMTGEAAMSEDSAFATLLYDVHAEQPRFSPEMLKMLHVDPQHMPQIVKSTDAVGPLLPGPAQELGVPAGVPVFSGGGDSALIGVGAGATSVQDTHVYIGTSGWVSTVVDKPVVDTNAMIAAIVGAVPGRYNYFAELETAGKCLEWVRDHLALDEIDIYLSRVDVTQHQEGLYRSLYDYLSEVIAKAPPGAGGMLFTPWLHGNRCPFEDPNARGNFIGLSLGTGKTEMLRAVIEGICYHLRWMLEIQDKKIKTSQRVRLVGGGALSAVTSQILADVLGRGVDVVEHPQDVGAVGAALVAAVGLGGLRSLDQAADLVALASSYEPNPANRCVYDKMFGAFNDVHKQNKAIFKKLAYVRDELCANQGADS